MSLGAAKTLQNTRSFIMDFEEQGSHARGVYHTQYTSRMEKARVKQDKGANKNNSKRVVKNLEEMKVGTKEKVINKAYITLRT